MFQFKHRMILLVALVLIAAACVCTSALPSGLGGGGGDDEAVAVSAIDLPQTHENAAAGFRISLPQGWAVEDFLFFTVAAESEAALENESFTAPVLFAAIGPADEIAPDATTPEDLLETESAEMTEDFALSEFRSITVGGSPAAEADLSGSDPDTGEEIEGRIVVILGDTHAGFILGASPPDRWEGFAPTFDAMIQSIEFFPPDPDAAMEGMVEEEVEGEAAEESPGVVIPDTAGGDFTQWASRVTVSSEYGTEDWSGNQVLGPPDTFPECGDLTSAWASATSDTLEWLEVGFDTPVIPNAIIIYETYNPGSIYQVEVVDQNGTITDVYEATPEVRTECPYLLTIPVTNVTTPVDQVNIYVDQRVTQVWNEIDAVQLIGLPEGGAAPPAPSGGGLAESGTGPDVPMPSGEPTAIKFVNNTDVDMCYVFVTPSAAEDWGSDHLDFTDTSPGGIFTSSGMLAGVYDIKVEDCDRNLLAWNLFVDVPYTDGAIEAPVDPLEHSLTFTNDLDEDICAVHMTRVEDFDEYGWRRNLLSEDEAITVGSARMFKSGAGDWNFRFETCGGGSVIEVFTQAVSGMMDFNLSSFK
jgi:hypothetical protein